MGYLCVMSILLYAILAYILYQFIFKLVIPVYLATRQVKKGFREMQQRMQEQQGGHARPENAPSGHKNSAPTPKAGEYIEFEEIK